MPVRSMTLTTSGALSAGILQFQMPVRSMTLTTAYEAAKITSQFQMPVRSMTLTTAALTNHGMFTVSDACQINDFDHRTYNT